MVFNDAGIGLSFSYVNFIPEFVKQPQTVITELSANVSMTCEAEAFPYPAYQWQRKEQNGFTNLSAETNNSIKFQPISYLNAGIYRCTATNEVNNTIYVEESETATLFGML